MAEPFYGGDQTALPPDAEVFVTRDGKRGTIPRADLEDYQRHGWQLETPEGTTDARMKQEYGDRPGAAALQGAASTITFGGSDLALSQLDPEGARETEKQNEGAYFAGAVGGALLGGGVGMGGAVSGVGRAVESGVARVAGEGLGARLVAGGAKAGAEGAFYGAGQGVHDVALDPHPLTWEGAAATIGSDVLGGAAIGAGLGVGGALLAEGAGAAKRMANAQLEKMGGAEAGAVDRGAYPEIATMDKAAAREAVAAEREAVKTQRAADLVEGKAAREAELANISQAKDAAAAELHKDAVAYKDYLREDPSAFIATSDKEAASILKRSKLQIMKGLDNVEGFVEKRGSAGVLDGLQKQKGALQSVLADADEVVAGAATERQAMLDALPKPVEGEVYLSPEQAKGYAKYAGVEIPKGQAALAIPAEDLATYRSAIESGAVNPPGLQRVLDAQGLLAKNQELLDKFAAVKAAPTSPALEAIDARLEAARAGVGKTPRLEALEAHLADLGEDSIARKMAKHAGGAAGGALGFHAGGFVGAMAGHEVGADIGAKIYDRLVRKIQSGNALRAKSIAASVGHLFATGAERGAKAVRKAAPPLASKILPAIRYAQAGYVDGVLGPANARESTNKLVNHFRERARELNAITERQPDGSYTMRMGARELLNARVQALWAVSPDVGNGVEKTQAARVQFLASKLPRDPSPAHLQVGPDTWEPSHAELAKFARYMDAVEHPENVVQRLSTATMTPEDAEVLKSVYPQTYANIQGQIYNHLADLRTTLPYDKRLVLSIYLDVPVDRALTPEALSVYQRPAQPSQPAGARPQGPATQMPTGQVEPTRAQRFSS